MTQQYIHLDSAYRNRTRFPLPSSFIVPIASNNSIYNPSAIQAEDPISNAYPVYLFTGQSANRGPEAFNGGTHVLPILNIGASTVDGFYNGYNIFDITLGENRLILNYIGSTQTVVLDHPFSLTWADTDTYTITDPSTASTIHLQPQAIDINNFYNGMYIYDRTINQFRVITSYNGDLRTASLQSPFVGWAITNSYDVRSMPFDESGLLVAASQLTVTLPITASSRNEFYTGKFLYITTGAAAGQSRIISSYNGTTRVATLVPPGLSPVPVPGDTYEILQYSRDNSCPLLYSGSVLSQQETVNYEVELITLDIPNKEIITPNGSVLSYYPYIIVELSNDTATGGYGRSVLYSNNPNTIRATFIVSITDVNDPNTTQFLSLSSNGMKQTMRFKPNDNLRFSVKLPSGILFNVGPDTVSPLPPNPDIQISAVFSIKRIAT